jgi:hypothetical protein
VTHPFVLEYVRDSEQFGSAKDIFAPLTLDIFLRQYLGRLAVRIQSSGEGFFRSFLNENALKSLQSSYTDGERSPYRDTPSIPGLVRQSLTVGAAETQVGPIQDLCTQLSCLMVRHVAANLYFSLPGGYELARHTDPHDVMVMQLSGSKEWFLSFKGLDDYSLNLVCGECLYLPAGITHRTLAGPLGSVHLTLGIS